MDCSIRVITWPRPETWPSPAVVILVIVTVVAVRLGYLPPDWVMVTLGTGLTAARAALPARPENPREIWRASWA